MAVVITVVGEPASDELRALRQWLLDESDLRGRVRLEISPPAAGTLGAPDVSSLVVALGPDGAVAALSTMVIAFLRYRTSDVTYKLTRRSTATGDQLSVELSAKRVRGLDRAALEQLTATAERLLGDEGDDESAP